MGKIKLTRALHEQHRIYDTSGACFHYIFYNGNYHIEIFEYDEHHKVQGDHQYKISFPCTGLTLCRVDKKTSKEVYSYGKDHYQKVIYPAPRIKEKAADQQKYIFVS